MERGCGSATEAAVRSGLAHYRLCAKWMNSTE